MTTARFTTAGWPVHRRNPAQCHGSRPGGRIRCGVGTSSREDAQIAADLLSRACLRERISKGRRQTLILHADNGNVMRAATLESRLEDLGVLRSFSRPSAAVGLHVIDYNLIRLGKLLRSSMAAA